MKLMSFQAYLGLNSCLKHILTIAEKEKVNRMGRNFLFGNANIHNEAHYVASNITFLKC